MSGLDIQTKKNKKVWLYNLRHMKLLFSNITYQPLGSSHFKDTVTEFPTITFSLKELGSNETGFKYLLYLNMESEIL